jgi:putative membrane protein
LFWIGLGGLVLMGFGLAVVQLLEELFARADALGYLGLALTLVAALGFVTIVTREVAGLVRLDAVESLRSRAQAALDDNDREAARVVVRDLLRIARTEPRLARARASMEVHLGEIIDGADLVRLAERELMATLDADARQLVADAAKRVSIVTAVSPRAIFDMAFVLLTVLTLVRRLADVYGARPGTLGRMRLLRLAFAHLAITGGVAASDSIIQQMLGHGVAAKLSARLGEGVLNGLLTARLGLAAMEVTRPLPFSALPAPTMTDLAGDLLRRRGERREAGLRAALDRR